MNSNLSLIFLKMPHPTQKDYMNIITITGIPQLTEGLCSKSLPVVSFLELKSHFLTETTL